MTGDYFRNTENNFGNKLLIQRISERRLLRFLESNKGEFRHFIAKVFCDFELTR